MTWLRHAPLPDGFRLDRLAAGAWAAGEDVAWLEGGGGDPAIASFGFVAFGKPRRVVEGSEASLLGELARALGEPLRVEDPGPLAPFPWRGGAVGFLGYECNRFFERLPGPGARVLGLPDLRWVFPSAAVVARRGEAPRILAFADERGSGVETLLARAAELERAGAPGPAPGRPARVEPTWPRERHERAVARIREHIAVGDLYQANLSQPFEAAGVGDPIDVHRRLLAEHPTPFAAFLGFGDRAIVSASPELFLRRRGARLETRPIKGTRRRRGDDAADCAASAELLASEKDQAELAMIVDLERNDLARVCEPGSVRVERARAIETYASVFHGVATVSGALQPGAELLEILAATFPSGSITGCPKIRSMEILHSIESEPRGPSFGALGWIGYDRDFDLNVAIRTMSFAREGGAWRASFRTGGGIVADSEPAAEYQESLDKARALARALCDPTFPPPWTSRS